MAVGDEPTELVLATRDGSEVSGSSHVGTEFGPLAEFTVLAMACFRGVGFGGIRCSSAEQTLEESSGCRWSSRHGVGCG